MNSKQTGFRRLYFATYYSLKGLKAAFASEAAIRQELAVISLLVPVTFWLNVSSAEQVLLVMSLVIVLIAELMNTALEALADHISTDVHALIGKAKDVGSAAVFVSLVMAGLTWAIILF
ncbi:diacylglycerol kinase [Alteromonas aestuariivivens]|uniref:Diacylglycerol kinase n=1 Tax=Alteromonas aestuariivivens TaxID=1938339 RepID=A0A3D8M3C3_9ALTE|nr:diacylglycerol kinase [Alteromonas aestuariivivens]RDV24116.1 diacylglycerol kinase [Alteromonas aestuariivivens]